MTKVKSPLITRPPRIIVDSRAFLMNDISFDMRLELYIEGECHRVGCRVNWNILMVTEQLRRLCDEMDARIEHQFGHRYEL